MSEELTSLQALDYLVGSLEHCKLISTGENKVIKTIKTALKEGEIIKKKDVIINWLKICFKEVDGFEENNRCSNFDLTREEYELLKEVFNE